MNADTPDQNADALLELARKRFGDLTDAEAAMLRGAARGETADCTFGDQDTAPANAANWDDKRVINAERLVWLCTDAHAASRVTHRGIAVEGARVDGEVDLDFARVPFPLDFDGCRFDTPILMGNAQIPALNLNGTHTGPISADGLKVEGDVSLNKRFKAEGKVRLLGATIGGDLDCSNGQFTNADGCALSADGLKVEGSVFLREGFETEGEVRLLGATIGGNLDCLNAQFTNPDGRALSADGLKVEGSVFLSNGFKAEGEVSLLGGTIGGNLDCDDGQFTNPGGYALSADRLKVEGSVFLRNGFKVQGQVRLLGATIGGDLDCVNGQFTNPGGYVLNADKLKVEGSVFLRNGFKAQGEVRLLGATIGGNLDCLNAQFTNPNGYALNADRLKVEGSVFLRNGFKAEGRLVFVNAAVDRTFIHCGVRSPAKATLDLRSARIGTLLDEASSWPDKDNLFLQGLVYDELGFDSPTDAATRKEWLRLQPKFLPQPYEQLAKVLREAGHEDDAKEILVAKNEEYARTLSRSRRAVYRLLGLTTGYGYRPWRALWIGLAIVAIGWLVFGLGFANDAMARTKDAKAYCPEHCALVYSLDAFVPLIDLRQVAYWLPDSAKHISLWKINLPGALLCGYLWVHTLLGWIFTTLLVVGLTGVIRR